MKIRTKIVFLVISVITFYIIASLVFTIYNIDINGQLEIEEFEKTEKRKIDKNLESFVELAYSVIETNHKNATDKKYLEYYYGRQLNDVMDVVNNVLKDKYLSFKKGKLSKQLAQQQVINFVKNMRYDNGNGYFWIFNNQKPFPKMIVEPIAPELDGKILDNKNFNNALGTNANPFVVSVAMCDTSGEGYVDYSWYRPSVTDEVLKEESKFSYVRLFKEWNWILGTGIYLEDATKDAMEKTKEDIRQMRYNNGLGYYWINDDKKPTPMLIMNPLWEAGEGKIHTDKKFNCANNSDQNLYQAFLEACERRGSGTVEYVWDKPIKGGETVENAPKSSFVKYFRPFGWIIGSGVYIDDIDKTITAKKDIMEVKKKDMIINSILISVPLGTISILFLIWMMNKHFRETSENREDEIESTINKDEKLLLYGDENKKQSNSKKTEEDLSTNFILKTFIKEQSKLLAFNKIVENATQNSSSNAIEEISKDIKEMTKLLREEIKTINKSKLDNFK
ncbi:MAG: hypothetical protein B6I24_02455 [Bacteroidetes bacterium 4572_128]|nr:MAG: hypothetical protein B6I24_02455 [Bacteroidetes bacterium 4572_128]